MTQDKRDGHRLIMELFRPDGSALGAEFIEMDTEPASEAVRFQHLRRGLGDPEGGVIVEPSWAREGRPFVGGLVARSGRVTCEIPHAYFSEKAREISSALIQQKRLQAGETYLYRVIALSGNGATVRRPAKPPPQPDPFASIAVEEEDSTPACAEASMEQLKASATPLGEQSEADFPVFIPARVIEEASQMTEAARDKETGGLLIGFLRRDPALEEAFVEITAQIPARNAEAERFSLTFNDETWTDLGAAIGLRRAGEAMLGWWHSHPGSKYWCNPQCSPEARANCPFSKNFFSHADAALHRMVFPRAFSVALVVTNTDAGLKYAMFGWRNGVIAQRGFSVLNPIRHIAATEITNNEGDTHGNPCTKSDGDS